MNSRLIKKYSKELIASGVKEQCDRCGLLPEYNGKPIALKIYYFDEMPLQSSLRFICPNCFSQTPHANKRKRKILTAIEEIQKIEDRACFKALGIAAKSAKKKNVSIIGSWTGIMPETLFVLNVMREINLK